LLLPTGAGTLLLAIAIAYFLSSRWETALPNEWLLLIQDGKLVRAGVGLTVFRSLGAQVVKFSSCCNKVAWTAQEMTNQRAGVQVKGFAVWGIYRPDDTDQDGPFRAYKSIPGLAEGDITAGSQFVQQLVESIIRSAVANMSIMDVMQKRDNMRQGQEGDHRPAQGLGDLARDGRDHRLPHQLSVSL